MSTDTAHPWTFRRAGGLVQVCFNSGADIARLGELDRKLWVALACPVKGLEFDERTLALIDCDADGRVRAPEMVAAVEFLKARLVSLDSMLEGSSRLPLALINPDTEEGRAARASALRILSNLGKSGADAVEFADIAEPARIFAGSKFNGDGVITPESADDEATASAIKDILAACGGAPDRSGKDGIPQASIDAFFADAAALLEWNNKVRTDETLRPLGEGTAAAWAAVAAVREKVEDYFARCKLAAFDARATGAVNRAEEDYQKIAAQTLSTAAPEVAGFPLARIEPDRALPLVSGLNPAWQGAIATLRAAAVVPLFGEQSELSESQWQQLIGRLAPYTGWLAARPASKLDSLGLERVEAIVSAGTQAKIQDLMQKDLDLKAEAEGIDSVEKLVRLHRDFARLLNNFVSFGEFYSNKRAATFLAGRLYLDSRECQLCVWVDDIGKHAPLAGLSRCYLAYCSVRRRGGSDTATVLAIFTQGDSDYLLVGRNGLFVDNKGNDWDATIVKIVDSPISVRQAFFAPYKKFLRLIEEQVAKRAAAADAASDARLSDGAQQVANVDKAAATPAKPEPKKIDLGTIALIGTAISGVAATVGLVLERFFGLGVYMPLGLLAIILLISGPSMLIAALKLSQRSLGPVLDANGWAINGRVRINIPLGTALTTLSNLPKGSHLTLQDPFAEKPSAWPKVLGALVVAAGIVYYLTRCGVIKLPF